MEQPKSLFHDISIDIDLLQSDYIFDNMQHEISQPENLMQDVEADSVESDVKSEDESDSDESDVELDDSFDYFDDTEYWQIIDQAGGKYSMDLYMKVLTTHVRYMDEITIVHPPNRQREIFLPFDNDYFCRPGYYRRLIKN